MNRTGGPVAESQLVRRRRVRLETSARSSGEHMARATDMRVAKPTGIGILDRSVRTDLEQAHHDSRVPGRGDSNRHPTDGTDLPIDSRTLYRKYFRQT